MNFYIFNTVQVTRKAPPTESAIVAEQAKDLGLPFYYYNPKISMLLIVLGLVVLFTQVCIFLIIPIFFKRTKEKDYRCVQCGRIYRTKDKQPPVCSVCGAPTIPLTTRTNK